MTDLTPHLDTQKRKLSKALEHLGYSYKKVLSLPCNIEKLDEESLETWESFSARFSRVSELFLARYLRTRILIDDPGFSGSFRDFVNQAEKLEIIENANSWMQIRELRNIAAHDYSEKDLAQFFDTLRKNCPQLLSIQECI
jgi:hypothetical protein